MNYTFFIISITGFLIAGATAVFVLARDPRSQLTRIFFAFAAAVACLCLTDSLTSIAATPELAEMYSNLSVSFWVIFIVLLLWFCLALAQVRSKAVLVPVWTLAIISSVLIAYFNWQADWFYKQPIMTGWGMAPPIGVHFYWFVTYSVAMICLQLILLLYIWRRAETRLRRIQARIVFGGLSAGLVIGMIFDVIMPLFFPTLPSGVPAATMIYIITFGYAIVRYGLLIVTPGALAGQIINTMPDLLVFADTDRRVMMINHGFSVALGYQIGEIIGQPCSLFHADEAAHRRAHEMVSQRGVIVGQKDTLKKKDGGLIPVNMSGAVVKDAAGDEMGDIFIYQDTSQEQGLITEQKNALEELTRTKERMLSILEDTTIARDEAKIKAVELAKAVEDLKSVDKMKTEFLSVISHELRTPLTPIKGYTGLLLSGQMGQLSNEQKKAVEIIQREEEHLLGLINSVLDVSRLVAGKSMQTRKEPILMKYLLETIAQALAPQFNACQINFDLSLPEGFPTIEGDPDKLSQLVTNILGNSLKFTPKTGWIKVTGAVREGQIEISIADNGIGIAPKNLEKIFDKFYQVDSSVTRAAGGVGLGLAIAREIVEAHGGKIWAESGGLGQGTTIKFTLPVSGLP